MKDFVKKWNWIDNILYQFEYTINKIKENIAFDEPDVESIIETETNHLRSENNLLKELQYPKQIKEENRQYFCPNQKCRIEIERILIEQYRIKYCPECGQRIYSNYHSGAARK